MLIDYKHKVIKLNPGKMETIKFNACEYLDYSDNYTAKKELIVIDRETKLCWNRPVIDNSFPRLVQFCKLRGRLCNPYCCTSEKNKMCSEYNEIEHTAIYKSEIT